MEPEHLHPYVLVMALVGVPDILTSCAIVVLSVSAGRSWMRNRRRAQAVAERKRWEEALEESNQRLTALVQTSPLPILAMDATGYVKIWNPAAERLFGWTEDEVLGLVNPAIPSDRIAEVQHLFLRAASGEPVVGFETVRRCRDGSLVEVSVSTAAMRDPQGAVIGIISIIADITQRKQLEISLRDSRQRYAEAYEREREAAERLRNLESMKDTFLTAVSHELRTPLTAVLGFARTLEDADDRLRGEQRADLINRLVANAKRLDRLLADLLDLDRLGRGGLEPRRRPMNLSVLIGRVIDGSGISLRRKVHFEAVPIVSAVDVGMVERMVENLLANADRYTPPTSEVWVGLRRDRGDVVIEVSDSGPGVPAALRREIFEPFRQGSNGNSHSPGVGIGLSLVARFAEAHGGRAEVAERPGGGAVFRILLPEQVASEDGAPSIDPRAARRSSRAS